MDCRAAHGRLIAFHFDAMGDDSRTLLEAHLQGCPGCLRAHLSLKRALDEGLRRWAPGKGAAPAPPLAATGLLCGLLGAVLALLLAAGFGLLRPQAPAQVAAQPAAQPSRTSCPLPSPPPGTYI